MVQNITKKDLSKDQLYLLDMVKAIQTGHCEPELAVKDPGPISHSRWLTCANRVLRLYISQTSPSRELKTLVDYIMMTYAPVWFDIKQNHSVKYGPKHIFKVVETTRNFPDNIKNIIDPVIARNAYFCHPENMLLAMVTDERRHIRELGYRRVLKSKNQKMTTESVRTFKVPILNFNATDYVELIDWNTCILTPPPLMEKMTTEIISSLIRDENIPDFEFLKYPCHTQAVERCVKLVTEAAGKVCGHHNRDGYIRATLKSRAMMPIFETKQNFKANPIS